MLLRACSKRKSFVLQILIGIGELLLTPNNGDAAQDHAYRIYRRKDRSIYERSALRPLHDPSNACTDGLPRLQMHVGNLYIHCLPMLHRVWCCRAGWLEIRHRNMLMKTFSLCKGVSRNVFKLQLC